MLLFELITELRRNPEVNVRNNGHTAAVKYLKSLPGDLRDYGVSMTEIPKLGINPKTEHHTPIGIYFYPADYYVRIIEGNYALSFQHDARYIQILQLSGNVETISSLTADGFNRYIEILYKNINQIAQLRKEDIVTTKSRLKQYIENALDNNKADVNTPGGHLWYILYGLSYGLNRDIKRNSLVLWNSLIRMLGIDIVVDYGGKIIHENEPTQGVALTPTSIKHLFTFENSPGDYHYKHLAKRMPKPTEYYYLDELKNYLRRFRVRYHPKFRKEILTVWKSLLTYLEKYPHEKVYDREINFLMLFFNDEKIKRFLQRRLADQEFDSFMFSYKNALEKPERFVERQEYLLRMIQAILPTYKMFSAEPEIAQRIQILKQATDQVNAANQKNENTRTHN